MVLLVAACVYPVSGKAAAAQSSDVMRIENDWLAIEFDWQSVSFSAIAKSAGLKFIERGTLRAPIVTGTYREVMHPTWGHGHAIEIAYRSGEMDRLVLFNELPFILFQSTFRGDGGARATLDRMHATNLTLGLQKEPALLRALGTAGLTKVTRDSNPGSYSFLAVGDPETRAGVVAGWLTHERGSGLLFSDIKDGKAVIDAHLDYGRLSVKPGEMVESETLLIGYFDDARLGLEAYADAIAEHDRIKLPPQPAVYCTWYHARASNERDLLKSAAFAREHLSPFGFSVIQIDDGWQAGVKGDGPRRDFTTHRSDGPYPGGMTQTAEKIKQLGLTPGIWFMPFAGTWDDPVFADKQDLFATKDGKPFVVRWGGTCLDMTNPKTQQYVRSVARRIARDWGYKYFKLDGLWTGMATEICYINTGYKDDHLGRATLHDPTKTHVEAYRNGLRVVREAAGDDVFFLGCNVAQNMRTLGASFGLVDAMRIGPDNGRKWSSMCRGPFSGSNLYFLHGRVWYNDPDPIYIRDDVPLEHARALTSWVAVTGQLNASSTDYGKLAPERLHLLQRSMPAHGLKPRPVDLFEQRVARVWLLTDDRRAPRRDVVGLFNWEEKEPTHISYAAERIGLPQAEAYVAFDYWADRFVKPFNKCLESDLPPASCRILAVRPVSPHPQVISTSRHITQGIVDLVEEKWDSATHTLSGVSRVVANDPYELRIVAMGPGSSGKAIGVAVSPQDSAAGVKIELLRQDVWRVRVRIDAPESREVRWSVAFASEALGRILGEVGPEAGVPVGEILRNEVELSFTEHLPRSEGITKITISRGMNVRSGGTLTKDKFRKLIDSASPISPENKTIRAWHYAPWYSLTFETQDGVHRLSLFLGGRGFLQFPGGDVVAMEFRHPE